MRLMTPAQHRPQLYEIHSRRPAVLSWCIDAKEALKMKKTIPTLLVLAVCGRAAYAATDAEFAASLSAKLAAAPAAAVPASVVSARGGESVVADRTTDVEVALN